MHLFIEPYVPHHFDVESPHCLYVEESGNSDGLPVVFCTAGQAPALTLTIVAFLTPSVIASFCLISVVAVNPLPMPSCKATIPRHCLIPDAGHSASEPGVADALVNAADAMANTFA